MHTKKTQDSGSVGQQASTGGESAVEIRFSSAATRKPYAPPGIALFGDVTDLTLGSSSYCTADHTTGYYN